MKAMRMSLVIILSCMYLSCFSQAGDSSKKVQHFSGSASITNNGISLVPSFSFEKPAAIFLFSLGGERFSFDPDIRFGLNGKPWVFLFWARYKLFNEGKFRMNTGAHLALNFRNTVLQINNVTSENVIARRYLAAELAPNYFVGKNISIGSYYLYSHGLDNGTVGNTHFVTLNANFSRIPISRQFYLRAIPQFFYLNQDGKEGYYFTSTVTAVRKDFPLSFTTIINKKLRSEIPGKDFIWSLNLVYSFNRKYVRKM